MGCDIHLMVEVKNKWGWENGGSIDVGRNYELFSILSDVRNYNNIPHIEIKDTTNCSYLFELFLGAMGEDAHSPNYATLAELKKYYDDNRAKTTYSDRLVMERDAEGKILATCGRGGTNDDKMEPVGECSIFGEWGDEYFVNLIDRLSQFKEFYGAEKDDQIRIIYFFDN